MDNINWKTTPNSVNWTIETKELNSPLRVRFKKLYPDAVTPTYAKSGDAGLDLTAYSSTFDSKYIECHVVGRQYIEYGTGIAIEIPTGYVGLIFPRSSVSTRDGLYLRNSVGVIDSGYRGEIKLRFSESKQAYQKGDKIGQLIILPYPTISLEEVESLSETDRGIGGFGSTTA